MKTKYQILTLITLISIPCFASAKKGNGERFSNTDTNGDQMISQAEAEAAGAQRLVKNFDKIDTNGDGQLTKEEIKSKAKKHGKKAQQRRKDMKALDSDGNGAISYDEASEGGAEKLLNNFDKFDLDGDGEVTRDEMREARQQLKSQKQGNL